MDQVKIKIKHQIAEKMDLSDLDHGRVVTGSQAGLSVSESTDLLFTVQTDMKGMVSQIISG